MTPAPRDLTALGEEYAGCRVAYDPHTPCAIMSWTAYPGSALFRDANEHILELVVERQAAKLLGDIEALGEIEPRDQTWLTQDWLPRATEAGLRHVALVTPAFELRHSPVRLVGEDRPPALALEYFDDLEAGRVWLRSR